MQHQSAQIAQCQRHATAAQRKATKATQGSTSQLKQLNALAKVSQGSSKLEKCSFKSAKAAQGGTNRLRRLSTSEMQHKSSSSSLTSSKCNTSQLSESNPMRRKHINLAKAAQRSRGRLRHHKPSQASTSQLRYLSSPPKPVKEAQSQQNATSNHPKQLNAIEM
jgi:hypothetical protein